MWNGWELDKRKVLGHSEQVRIAADTDQVTNTCALTHNTHLEVRKGKRVMMLERMAAACQVTHDDLHSLCPRGIAALVLLMCHWAVAQRQDHPQETSLSPAALAAALLLALALLAVLTALAAAVLPALALPAAAVTVLAPPAAPHHLVRRRSAHRSHAHAACCPTATQAWL